MNQTELKKLLNELINRWEDEITEFKQAGDNFSTSDIGKYFSALANEANLRNCHSAWLVFGVDNDSKNIIGTDYRPEHERLQSLKIQIANNTDPSITFRNIYEYKDDCGRVILFEIPQAPRGIPIAWKGHYYSRAGESLTSLGLEKQDDIRQQTLGSDWTAGIVPHATLNDLHSDAIQKARESFALKYKNRFSFDEIMNWPLETFLDRARITQQGKITRTAIILLGKPESAYYLLPYPAQITWKLEGIDKAYEHFGPPFLLNTTIIYRKIRNYQMRILPFDELIPLEVSKYDQKVIHEALHNCIAHQDYRKNSRIIVTESTDFLQFENEGDFYEGQPDDYTMGNKTPRKYRNSFLTQAMAELNMIDTMGYGIYEMYKEQARRYFPMPDYDLSESGVVKLKIYGKVIDPAYSLLLIQNKELTLKDIIALDHIQKGHSVPEETIHRLRRAKLIEGRKPNLYLSASTAITTGKKSDYIKTRAQDDKFYAKLIIDYLSEFECASREEINYLLWDKLSDGLDDEQKTNRISNLLTKLRRSGHIKNIGSKKAPDWIINENDAE